MYAGIDGCKIGWVCVRIEDDRLLFNLVENIYNLDFIFNNRLTLIDIPIGLPSQSRRFCDLEAKDILKPKRHNSVFLTPVRNAIYANSYEEACRINYEAIGKKFSKQTWGISQKIKEIDAYKSKFPDLQFRESHPEICFWALNGKTACSFPKKDAKGIQERLAILDKVFPRISKELTSFADATLKKHVTIDDIIDAAVLACTAMREKQLEILSNGEKDQKGIPMEIVYSN